MHARTSARIVAIGLIVGGALYARATTAQTVPVAAILMYHHVSATIAPGPYARALTVDPKEFAHQLSWLRLHGCELVTVDTIVDDVSAGRVLGCEIGVTFDDGYADQYDIARGLLLDAGDTATFYVSSGYVGQPGHLSAREIAALARDGFQMGAHTVHHVDLTAMPLRDARSEIVSSRDALARWSGAAIDGFAYPAGQANSAIEELVRAAGFRNGLTTQPGSLSAARVRADPYALPRYRIERDGGSELIMRIVGRLAANSRSIDEVRAIARRRTEGNDPQLAERIGAALLSASFPEPLLKVRVLRMRNATVVGIMLSGVKMHADIDRAAFAADAGGMVERAFDARPDVSEVDVWAVVPLELQPASVVSGDYAEPTTRTVFSAAVTRQARETAATRTQMLGTVYWGGAFLRKTHAQ